MIRTALLALFSHWRRHPGQALTLVLGLALATALWTGVQAINAEARAAYDRAAEVLSQNDRPVLVPRSGDAVALADYVALRRAGWAVAPVLEGAATLGGTRLSLLGLDPLSTPVLPTPTEPAEVEGADGLAAFIGPPGQLFVAPGQAAALAGQLSQELVESADVAPGNAVGDIATVARLIDRPDSLTRLILIEEPAAQLPALDDVAPDLVIARPDPGGGIGGLTGSFHLNLTAFALLSFTVGLFIVHGAIGLAFEQRRGTVRTLRALGLPARTLAGLVAAELTVIAILAGLIGVGLGYLIAAALLPDVAATLRGLYGAPAPGSLSLRPGWVAAGFAMALAGTAIAAAQSLWRLAHLPILAAAQPRAWRRASEAGLRWQAAAAAALLVIAAAVGAFGDGLIAGFATLGALLLGAALALPPALAVILAAAERRARAPMAQWFWADTRQQLPGLSLALMALLLALAANIGVGTMVGSFRATFTGWLDQRLSAEVYLNAGSAETAAAMRPWLADRTDAVLPLAFAEADLGGAQAVLRGLADHATYHDGWPLVAASPGAWEALAQGEGMFVNEQFAHRAGTAVGARVPLDGTPRRVLAIYSDYGNPRAEALVTLELFSTLYPDVPEQRFALRLDPAAAPGLVEEMRAAFALRADAVIDQGALKDLSLGIFERTFAVTGALNVLTLGVAALAILTSLLTLATQRLPQVAPVWALGVTRRDLGRLELLRAAILAALTAVLAIPVGLVLAWILLAVVNVAAFGWRLPMLTFPVEWLRLGALALLAALLAATLPARRLAARPPGDLLKVFASER